MTISNVAVDKPTAYVNAPSSSYRAVIAVINNLVNGAGGSPGTAVTVPVVLSDIIPDFDNLPADLNYGIQVSANHAVNCSWSAKTVDGFNVVLTPLNAGDTVAAGLFDVEVSWFA